MILFRHKLLSLFTLAILFTGLNSRTVKAQESRIDTLIANPDTTKLVRVIMKDGAVFRGKIIEADSSQVELSSINGRFFLIRSNIESISFIENRSAPTSWFKNPNATRLFFGSTGRGMKEGEGYYQNIYVFFSNIAVGFADGVSGSLGFSMVPGIGLNKQLFVLSAKYGYSFNANNHAALGVSTVSGTFFESQSQWPIISYGVYTWGSSNASLTAGGGMGFFPERTDGALTLGGEYRVSERISFVSENIYFPKVDDGILSYGIRFMGENISADLAFVRPAIESANVGFGIPYVDFVFNF